MSDSGAFEGAVQRHARFAGPFPAAVRLEQSARTAHRGLSLCPEIDCLRSRLPPAVITAAEQRARLLNIGADEVLVAAGHVSEETYCRALAFSQRVRFVELDDYPRASCPLDDDALLLAARGDVLPFKDDWEVVWAIAPRGLKARALIALLAANPTMRARVRIITPDQLRRFVTRQCERLIARQAAEGLRIQDPRLSAAQLWRIRRGPWRSALWGMLAALVAGVAAAPALAFALFQAVMTSLFLGSTALRLFGAARGISKPKRFTPRSDASLPRYTIIAALYDEVEALPGLIASLKALDYPVEKLDIKLVLEAHDNWTRVTAEFLRTQMPFDILIASSEGPRTKPKALNCALPFARGDLLVVYDAEDRPEPDQLRRAAQMFDAGDDTLACVQARLTIDNTRDTWLTRLFTAEYAGLFDVLLPGLASLRLPIPLGGSSNHFRTATLREVGGWDPYNVTEDADLGIRMARLGYTSGMIASTTYEEAPGRLKPWLHQRTRWFKGWMQTLVVHMRAPTRLWRELGAGAAAFYLVLGGTVAAALVQPLVFLWFAYAWLTDMALFPTPLGVLAGVHLATLIGGYVVSALLGLVGLKRRRLLSAAWAFVALPLLWALLSYAAWRALYQLIFKPQLWEKTQHGQARTSRLGAVKA